MAPPETAHKSMKPNTNTEAAETAQTTDSPAVVHERLVSGSFIPAPWRVNDTAPASYAIEAEQGIITRVYYCLCDSRIEMERKEAFATASLIAAAPEMLAALERIIRKFDAGMNVEGHCICDARAAIENARGLFSSANSVDQ